MNSAFSSSRIFDVIVVGSGLTGSWVTRDLAEAGLSVLLLEAGPWLSSSNHSNVRNSDPTHREAFCGRQPVQSRHPAYWQTNPELFVDDLENPYTVGPNSSFVWIRGRQVGGRGLTWGGVTLRFSDQEFRSPERDGFGERWPIAYSDLAPYYEKVEQTLQVRGSLDGLPQLPDGVFASPSAMTESELTFKRRVEEEWPQRKVVVSRGVTNPNSSADGAGCRSAGTPSTLIEAALRTRRLTLRPDAVVSHLVEDKSSPVVKGVACVDRTSGSAFEAFGRTVVLCASTIESVRILLNSRSSRYPTGMGNSSGTLGKYLMDHCAMCVGGTLPPFTSPAPAHALSGCHSIVIPRYHNLKEAPAEFLRGYGIWGGLQRHPSPTAINGTTWFLNALCEVLPRAENCVSISDNQVDAWGIPTPRITLRYTDNERRMLQHAAGSLTEMTSAAGLRLEFRGATLPGQYVHELGGARMGDNPATSVLNRDNQCWDLHNLFVLDGSCFVTSGWQNPSLTMMAIAARGADRIVDRFRQQWIATPV
jgi:choline dehydrogenase-like flavoprotein